MNNEAGIRRLLSFNADIYAFQRGHYDALMAAIVRGWKNIVLLLLEKTPDFPKVAHFHEAIVRGNLGIAQVLLDYGAQVNWIEKCGSASNFPLQEAVIYSQLHMVRWLIDNGADVNLVDDRIESNPTNTSYFPLLHTAAQRDADCLALLLEHGADPNVTWGRGQSALHFAAGTFYETRVQLLLDAGVEVNLETDTGQTPLYIATETDNGHVVSLLLERGANPNTIPTGHNLESPLMVSMKSRSTAVMRILLDAGANVNVKYNGETALHMAAQSSRDEFIDLLLDYGADWAILNDDGISAFDILKKNGNRHAVV